MIRSRGTRLGQPSGPVEIDWANPITAGIQFAHTPATINGATLVSGDYFGESYVGTGATISNQALVMPTPVPYLGTLANSTILAVGSTSAILGSSTGQIGAGGDAMICERGSTGNDIYKIGLTSVSSVLNAEFVYRNDGGNLLQLRASCAGLNDGRPLVVSAVKTGTNHRIGINGITNTGTVGSASTAFTNATLVRQIGCDRADGTSGWNGYIDFVAGWERSLSVEEIRSLEANPWQIYRARERRIWVGFASAGGGAGNATGSLAAITLTASTGTGSGSASASSAPAAVSLTAPQGTASGGATGFASGAPAAVSLSAPTASAVGSASATGALAGVSLSAPQASAQGAASASGTLDGIDLSAPTANATAGAVGLASGALAPISLTAAAGSASGSAIASAAYAGITLSAPTGSASAGQVGLASGALAPIGTTAPQGSATGAAAAFAAYTGITLTPAQGTASATSPVGNAAGSLRAISLTAITATASGGVVYTRAPAGSGYSVSAQKTSRPDRLQTSGRPATTNTRRP